MTSLKRPKLSRDYWPIRWHVAAFMAAVHALAIVALFHFSVPNLLAFLVLYTISSMGVTLGLHRLMSHKSYRVPKWLERLLVSAGALAAQGGPLEWVGLHRHHHLHSDEVEDHHDSRRGFLWAHIGWMFFTVPAMRKAPDLTKEMARDPYYRWLERNFLALQLPVTAILWAIGGWPMVLWGVPLRLCAVYHATWLVNSLAHLRGPRRYFTSDDSRNNRVVALLTWGEGWHNNHHHNQARARHGLTSSQWDPTYAVICFMERIGLANNVLH